MKTDCFHSVHTQDWWDGVRNELEKPTFNRKQMGDLYEEMRSILGDCSADSHGMFRKKFIKVCHFFSFFPLFLSQKYDSPEICEIRRLVQIIHQQVKRICSF